MNELLEQAKAAMEAGNKSQAQVVLARLLKAEPNNADAWYLLSNMAISPEQKETFLRKALAINPEHADAQADLVALAEEKAAEEAEAELPPPEPETELPPPDAEPALPEPEKEAALEAPEPAEELPAPPEEEALPPPPETALPADADVEEEATPTDEGDPASMPVSTTPLDYEAQAEGDTIPPWLAGEDAILDPAGAEKTIAEEEPPFEEMDTLPDWVQEGPAEDWLAEDEEVEGAVEAPADKPTLAEETTQPAPAGAPTPVPAEPSPSPVTSLMVPVLTIATIIVFLLLVYFVINNLQLG